MSEVFALDESEQFLIRKALEYVYILYENKPMSYHIIGKLIKKFRTEYQDDIDDVLKKLWDNQSYKDKDEQNGLEPCDDCIKEEFCDKIYISITKSCYKWEGKELEGKE